MASDRPTCPHGRKWYRCCDPNTPTIAENAARLKASLPKIVTGPLFVGRLTCGHHKANWIIEDEESGHGFCATCHPERLKKPAQPSEVERARHGVQAWIETMQGVDQFPMQRALAALIAAERADAVKGMHLAGCYCHEFKDRHINPTGTACVWCHDMVPLYPHPIVDPRCQQERDRIGKEGRTDGR